MVDSFSIFAEMLISKIFDYYLKEKIFPKRETDGKLVFYKVDNKFDDRIKAIESDPQFESSTIRLLIAILKVNLGGKTGVNYESTMHQVFFMAQSKKNEDIYIKVDDSANIDVGIFFKTDEGKILIPFEVKTGNKSYFKENTEEPDGHKAPQKNGWTFPKIKGSVPGILAHTEDVNLEIKFGVGFPTNYSLFGLKEKPDDIQLNNFEDKKDYIVKSLKDHQYLIKRDKNSIGFICRDTPTPPTNSVFQIISLNTLFSEFAEQYFKDRFVEEEKIFANTLKHMSDNIMVCWEMYRENYIVPCLDKIGKNNENGSEALIKKFKELIEKFKELIEKFNNHIAKFFINRKISDSYEEFSESDIIKLSDHIPEENLKNAVNELKNIIGIQKIFNGVFELREKRIEAEFNNYVHHFLNTIETDFYNRWVKK